jgi:tRNA uridine 5-carboxymethylaminomethyl modification enzyme
MFTSRAEFRLLLRQDNADERLMPIAAQRGLVERELFEKRRRIWEEKERVLQRVGALRVDRERWHEGARTGSRVSVRAGEMLKRPGVTMALVEAALGESLCTNRETRLGVEADIKYAGFVAKQAREIERLRRMEEAAIPQEIDYVSMKGLLTESRMKLEQVRPRTLAQAARIPGVTPADISVLAMQIVRTSGSSVSRETVG